MKLDNDLTQKIIDLKQFGFSSREIAKLLQVGKSTVNDIYARYKSEQNNKLFTFSSKPTTDGPKILVLDVETAAAEVLTFGRFKQNIGQANILKEGGWILCAAWRWLGSSKTESVWLSPVEIEAADDGPLVGHIFDLMQEADAIVAHNGLGFDHKVIQTRSVYHGFGSLPAVKVIDTLQMAKKNLRLPSNRLDSIGEYFGLGRKLATNGIELWKKVQQGDENAMLQMVEYCEQDVNLLHEVYLKLRAVGNAANFNAGLYYKHDEEPTLRCPTCGSSNVAATGRAITTTLSVFDEYLCQDCGSIHRNRQTKTTKEDRSALLSAVK